ncbi:AraC family transcriptional regulator [Antrihabitans sp. YC3-6]|uniref:AraC family transcriptional regulator n=1 Tax=Antrihabitans stalagmiti TaxID=2799499 RepID=A0A934U4V0_9NOCA|nr:AraC family transcriptional regulator [Antrihabitans stalagmiti]MBJ8340786.1 AraC family transcriptional regulator [Antrihabitans stalagmiti]
MDPKPVIADFSTRGLPQEERVRLWEEHNAEALIGLGCRTLTGEALEAAERTVQLPQLRFGRVTGTPHVVDRTQVHIRSHPTDSIVAYFALQGDAFFYHEHGCEMVRPGQAIVGDGDKPFMRGFSHGLKEVVLEIPRSTFDDMQWHNTFRSPLTIDFTTDPHTRALLRLIGTTLQNGTDRSDAVEAAAIDLFRMSLGGPPASASAAHTAAATVFIAEHLHEPDLTVPTIAAAVGISERQLSRLFSADGVGVVRFILDQRLDRARSAVLSNPTAALSDIAAKCGFTSQSYFSKAFKARYGLSPTALRSSRV